MNKQLSYFRYKSMKAVGPLLHNVWVLRLVAVLSLLSILQHLVRQDYNSVALFALAAFLTKVVFKSHNMIVILGVPLVLVWLYSQSKREGFEAKPAPEKKEETATATTVKPKPATPAKPAPKKQSKTAQGISKTTLESDGTEMDAVGEGGEPIDESFEGVNRPKKQRSGTDIDYASTVEDAYDQLNQILGSDGIKRLTSDTQNLMKQQQQLAESMKGMGPIISGMKPMLEQAQSMMAGLGGGGGAGGGAGALAALLGGGGGGGGKKGQ